MAGRRPRPPRAVAAVALGATGDAATDRTMAQAEQAVGDLQSLAQRTATETSAVADRVTSLEGRTFNVRDYGATGDGAADDAPAINAALSAAAATSSGGAAGGFAELPPGTYLIRSPIILKSKTGLRGSGTPATIIKLADSFNDTAGIRNEHQDGTQEFAFLESLQIDGNKGGGAVCSEALVSWGSLFINSYIRDMLISDSSSVGLHVFATGGMGPILIENVWVLSSGGHNVLIEEIAGNTNACAGIVCINLTSEHQGSNKSAVYLKGVGNAGQCVFYNTHIEQGGSETGRTCITIDGVPHVLFDGVQLQTGNAANMTAGITIANVVQNVGIQIRGVTNINLINPVLQDLKNGVTYGSGNLPWYITADVVAPPALKFLPIGSSNSAVFQNSAGTDKAWFDSTGALTGSSPTGAALDIYGDAANDRALALQDHAKTRAFGWYFPDASSFRLRYFTGGAEVMNVDNSANVLFYQGMTLNALGGITNLSTAVKGTGTRAAAPSSGTHVAGEVVFNADPISGGFVGWVCVTGGSPGTWKSFGAIS